jgi:hypothetical protein
MKRFGLLMSFAIAADSVHHIAFAAATTDECSIAPFALPALLSLRPMPIS